jgi:hypothetical protein
VSTLRLRVFVAGSALLAALVAASSALADSPAYTPAQAAKIAAQSQKAVVIGFILAAALCVGALLVLSRMARTSAAVRREPADEQPAARDEDRR